MSQSVDTDLGRRLSALEGLRAVAVLAVVVTHAGFLTGTTGGTTHPGLVARMDFGVAVFFVLSGFLLYLPHARRALGTGEAPRLKDYALRRLARIYPAFLLCLFGTAFIVPEAQRASAAAWLATLGLVQTATTSWAIAPLNHLWSLSTEVSFYLALPLLARVLRAGTRVGGPSSVTRQLTRMAVLAVLAWGFRAMVNTGHLAPLEALSWLPAHLDWFVAGMALAVLRTASPSDPWCARVVEIVREAPMATRLVAVLLLWLATTRLAGPYDLRPSTGAEDAFKHLAYLVAAVALVLPSAVGGSDSVSRMLSSRPMVWLGTISYAVFLWHLPVMFAVQSGFGLALFGGHFWLLIGVTLVVTIPTAAASWYLLEHPVLSWAHRMTRRAPDPLPGVVGRPALEPEDVASRS